MDSLPSHDNDMYAPLPPLRPPSQHAQYPLAQDTNYIGITINDQDELPKIHNVHLPLSSQISPPDFRHSFSGFSSQMNFGDTTHGQRSDHSPQDHKSALPSRHTSVVLPSINTSSNSLSHSQDISSRYPFQVTTPTKENNIYSSYPSSPNSFHQSYNHQNNQNNLNHLNYLNYHHHPHHHHPSQIQQNSLPLSLQQQQQQQHHHHQQQQPPLQPLQPPPTTTNNLPTFSPIRPKFASTTIPEDFPLDFSSVDPSGQERSGAFRKIRRSDLQRVPRYLFSEREKRQHVNPLMSLTRDLNDTYQACNNGFQYSASHNPRRVLTKPSKPFGNEGFDNKDFDYILYVNDILGATEGHKYIILDVLGAGTFGQVVKCKNTKTQEIFAVKVVKNKPAYFRQSMMEVAILEALNKKHDPDDKHHILRLKDTFIHRKHLCLVFELLSVNLYELIKQNQFRGLSTNLVRVFTAQILDTLTVLNEARIIHCDLKPENILLKNLESPALKVIDFGSACNEMQTMYTYIQSRFYRSPEVLVGLPYTGAIDMWSLGCIAAELFLGLPLFPGSSEYNQLSRIVETLGHKHRMPPTYMIEMSKNAHRYFERYTDDNGEKCYRLRSLEQYSREQGKEEQPSKRYFAAKTLPDLINGYPIMRKGSMTQKEIDKEKQNRLAFIDFLQGLLNQNHFERWTPQQARQHPFITGELFTGPFKPPYIPLKQSPMLKISTNMSNHQEHSHNRSTPIVVSPPTQGYLSTSAIPLSHLRTTTNPDTIINQPQQQPYPSSCSTSSTLPTFHVPENLHVNKPPQHHHYHMSHQSAHPKENSPRMNHHASSLLLSSSSSSSSSSAYNSLPPPRVLEPPDALNACYDGTSHAMKPLEPLNHQTLDPQQQGLHINGGLTGGVGSRPRANTVGTMQLPQGHWNTNHNQFGAVNNTNSNSNNNNANTNMSSNSNSNHDNHNGIGGGGGGYTFKGIHLDPDDGRNSGQFRTYAQDYLPSHQSHPSLQPHQTHYQHRLHHAQSSTFPSQCHYAEFQGIKVDHAPQGGGSSSSGGGGPSLSSPSSSHQSPQHIIMARQTNHQSSPHSPSQSLGNNDSGQMLSLPMSIQDTYVDSWDRITSNSNNNISNSNKNT
ncbi:hypothetical protein F4703DRAFT_1592227 [Phycomyces blakesleeanus]